MPEICPACGEPRADHIGPPSPPRIKGDLGERRESRPGACLTTTGRHEHRTTPTPTYADTVTPQRMADDGNPGTVYLRMKFNALTRVAAEVRQMLEGADRRDPDVQSLRRDLDLIDQVAHEMRSAISANAAGVICLQTQPTQRPRSPTLADEHGDIGGYGGES